MIFVSRLTKRTYKNDSDRTRERTRTICVLPLIHANPMNVHDGASISHHIRGVSEPYRISSRISHLEGRVLGEDYIPQKYDVICARGKHIVSHYGNIVFRETLERNLERYHQARSKLDKSLIVIEIVNEIRSRTGDGGFIQQRKDRSDGKKVWIEIGDTLARAKVGHALRDTIRNNGSHSVSTTTDQAFQHRRSSSFSSSANNDNGNGDDEEAVDDAIDMSNNETAGTLHNDDAEEKDSRERRRQVYDASELLRMSLISISDTAPNDDEQLVRYDEDCSHNSFDCEIEDLLFEEPSE